MLELYVRALMYVLFLEKAFIRFWKGSITQKRYKTQQKPTSCNHQAVLILWSVAFIHLLVQQIMIIYMPGPERIQHTTENKADNSPPLMELPGVTACFNTCPGALRTSTWIKAPRAEEAFKGYNPPCPCVLSSSQVVSCTLSYNWWKLLVFNMEDLFCSLKFPLSFRAATDLRGLLTS